MTKTPNGYVLVMCLLCFVFGKNRERFTIKVWSKSTKVSLCLLFLTIRTYFSSNASSILPKLLSYSYGISCFIGAASIVVFKSRFSALFSCVSTDKQVHLASKTIIFHSHGINIYQYHQYHQQLVYCRHNCMITPSIDRFLLPSKRAKFGSSCPNSNACWPSSYGLELFFLFSSIIIHNITE